MKYKVVGIDKESGLETELVIEAPSVRDASALAKLKGCYPRDVQEFTPQGSSTGHQLTTLQIVLGSAGAAILGGVIVAVLFVMPRHTGSKPISAEPPPSARHTTSADNAIMGTIKGAIWFTRRDGTSDIVRGANVYLIPKLVSRSAASHACGLAIDHFKANVYGTDSTFDDLDKMGQDAFDGVRAHIGTTGEDVDAREVFLQARKNMSFWSEAFELYARALSVRQTMSNVDGKYEFSNVPPGRYYVDSTFGISGYHWDWFEPVTVAGSGLAGLDLCNQNLCPDPGKDAERR